MTLGLTYNALSEYDAALATLRVSQETRRIFSVMMFYAVAESLLAESSSFKCDFFNIHKLSMSHAQVSFENIQSFRKISLGIGFPEQVPVCFTGLQERGHFLSSNRVSTTMRLLMYAFENFLYLNHLISRKVELRFTSNIKTTISGIPRSLSEILW